MKSYKSLIVSSLLLTIFIAIPAIIILSHIFLPNSQSWEHLKETLLLEYILNSIYVMFGVGFLTFIFGFSTAWITTIYKFKFSHFFHYALVLPFAIPTYIAGYIYSGMFGVNGNITSFILNLLQKNITEVYFFDIMSLPGAILVMSFVLYPYVYIITKSYLRSESASIIDASRTLGLSTTKLFFKVVLPISRPAIVAGVILSVMEAVSDFGVMDYFGVSNFVTGIFRTWYGIGSLPDASKLASLLMLFVFLLIIIEKYQRKNKKYKSSGKDFKPISKIELTGFKSLLAILICFIPFFLGFLLPFIQMVIWFFLSYEEILNDSFYTIFTNSLTLAIISAFIITSLGLFFVYAYRRTNLNLSGNLNSVVKLGYSIPGAVIAVGILTFFSFFDKDLYSYLKQYDITIPFMLTGSFIAIIFGYCVRFLAVSINYFESGFESIPKSYDDAAKTMKQTNLQTLKRIYLPLLKGPLLASFIIVFIEVIKELPLTMILRPFNYDTLAIYALELTNQAQVVESSVPAIFIVALGIFSVVLLAKNMIKD